MIELMAAFFLLLLSIYVLSIVIRIGGGWNNKNIIPLVDRILTKLESGDYTVGEDSRWAYCGVSCSGGSILTCYKNGLLKADGLLLSFSSMFVRSTWYITDDDGKSYSTGYIQGLRLHRNIKEIYKKESQGHSIG